IDHPRLKESVLTNARIRAVFGGLTVPSACEVADEMCLSELNELQIKKALYHTTHVYKEETRTIYSDSEGETETESDTDMSGVSSGEVAGSMQAFTQPGDGVTTFGWFDPVGSSPTTSTEAESLSQMSSNFSASGSSRSRGRSTAHGKSVVPVWVPI